MLKILLNLEIIRKKPSQHGLQMTTTAFMLWQLVQEKLGQQFFLQKALLFVNDYKLDIKTLIMIILKTTKSSIEIVKQMVKEMNDFEFRAYTPECHFYYNLLCDELSQFVNEHLVCDATVRQEAKQYIYNNLKRLYVPGIGILPFPEMEL